MRLFDRVLVDYFSSAYLLCTYVRQFCFIYFETNLGMKDKMQHNSENYSSDKMAKQK